jgi:hypothetical protein
MPASNPRLTVTLKPSVQAVLQRLSSLTGDSQSALVGGLLEQSLPVMERMIQVFEAADATKLVLGSHMADSLVRAHTKLETQLGLALETFDTGIRPILDAAERVPRRAAKTGAGDGRADARTKPGAAAAAAVLAASTPVPVTRGSGTPKGPSRGGAARKAGAPRETVKGGSSGKL